MLLSYVLAVCRLVTLLVFAASFLTKVRDISAFELAITSSRLLRRSLSKAAVWLLLISELIVVLFLIVGGLLLTPGFLLADLLLLLFCFALGSVLVRNIETSCNCFGATDKQISLYHVVRNGGLLLFALAGLSMSVGPSARQESLSIAEWVLLGACAAVFVMVWLRIDEILELFRQS